MTNPEFDDLEIVDFPALKDFMNYVLEMGFHEVVKARFPIEPENISGFAMLNTFMSVDPRRHVTARVELGSTVEWAEKESQWIATLNVKVYRIDSKPPTLRSI